MAEERSAAGSGVLLEAGGAAEVRAGPSAPATVLIVTLLPQEGAKTGV